MVDRVAQVGSYPLAIETRPIGASQILHEEGPLVDADSAVTARNAALVTPLRGKVHIREDAVN